MNEENTLADYIALIVLVIIAIIISFFVFEEPNEKPKLHCLDGYPTDLNVFQCKISEVPLRKLLVTREKYQILQSVASENGHQISNEFKAIEWGDNFFDEYNLVK